MATLILLHGHFDLGHLESVKSEMATRGAPTLLAVESCGVYYLLEGCHRTRAAVALGLPIMLDLIEYGAYNDEAPIHTLGLPGLDCDDCTSSLTEIVGRGSLDDPAAEIETEIEIA